MKMKDAWLVLLVLLIAAAGINAAVCERSGKTPPVTSPQPQAESWGWQAQPRPPIYAAPVTPTPMPVAPTPEPATTPEPAPLAPMPEPVAIPELEPAPKPAPVSATMEATITFYACPPFCGTMRSGDIVFEGAAACGGALARGQRFAIRGDPTGREYVCLDTGWLGWRHVDIFFDHRPAGRENAGWEWQAVVGTYGVIELR